MAKSVLKTITYPYRFAEKKVKVAFGIKPKPAAPRPLAYYINAVLNVRNTFPVNSIKIDGHYLWPFLRSELTVNSMVANAQQVKTRKHFNAHQAQACTPNHLSFDMRQAYRREYGMKGVEDLDNRHVDFLFFVNLNSVDLNETEDGYYNRLTDPLYRVACEIGTAEKLELIKTASPSVFKRNTYAYPTTAIVPNFVYTVGHAARAEYPRGLIDNLNKMIPYMQITEAQFGNWIDWQMHMIGFFRELFAKYTPKVVFCHPYYYTTPMIFAARETGAKVVELQHGAMAGENTLSYDNWQEIPADGYQAMPDYFWVWGKEEHDRLWDVFQSDKPNRPKPIVGGYPWIEMSQEIDSGGAEKAAKLDAELRRYPQKRRALLTLDMFAVVPPVVEELIRQTQDDVLWVVRHHPKTKKKLRQEDIGSNVLTSDTVDQILLVSLFKKVDLHFSETSTSIYEADYFGVYNYICSERGLANYKAYIDAGLAGYCTLDNVEATLEEMREGTSSEKRQRLNYINQVNVEEVLLRLRDGAP